MKKTTKRIRRQDRPREFKFRCCRSDRPEHQCLGLKAQYSVEGSVHETKMEHAYRSVELSVVSFMQAIPGVYVLTISEGVDKRVWTYDFRPAVKSPEVKHDTTST